MVSDRFSAEITMREIKEAFSFSGELLLRLTIRYPQISMPGDPAAQAMINRHIGEEVSGFYDYACETLRKQAASYRSYALQHGYPFHPYEAVMNYFITYNRDCFLSYYRDQYTFTGGAHGSTIRFSDTFDLNSKRTVPLSSFFGPGESYTEKLLSDIRRQAEEQVCLESYSCFENYGRLIEEEFDEDNYYLETKGVSVYYQQYAIAPYASGIIVFTVPYETLHWHPFCDFRSDS